MSMRPFGGGKGGGGGGKGVGGGKGSFNIRMLDVVRRAVVDKELKELAAAAVAVEKARSSGRYTQPEDEAGGAPFVGRLSQSWTGATDLPFLQQVGTELRSCFGFQAASVKLQANNLHGLLRQLRSRPSYQSKEDLAAMALQVHALPSLTIPVPCLTLSCCSACRRRSSRTIGYGARSKQQASVPLAS